MVAFPAAVVQQERVAANATYWFALEPGDYVLEAHYSSHTEVDAFIGITVRADDNLSVDIPNMCI